MSSACPAACVQMPRPAVITPAWQDLLHDDRVEPEVGPARPAEFLRHTQPRDPGGAGLAEQRLVDQTAVLPLVEVRDDLPRDEGSHRLSEQVVAGSVVRGFPRQPFP
jgi:hypothetical protein